MDLQASLLIVPVSVRLTCPKDWWFTSAFLLGVCSILGIRGRFCYLQYSSMCDPCAFEGLLRWFLGSEDGLRIAPDETKPPSLPCHKVRWNDLLFTWTTTHRTAPDRTAPTDRWTRSSDRVWFTSRRATWIAHAPDRGTQVGRVLGRSSELSSDRSSRPGVPCGDAAGAQAAHGWASGLKSRHALGRTPRPTMAGN